MQKNVQIVFTIICVTGGTMISREQFDKKQIVYCFSSEKEKISIKNDNVIVKDFEGKIKFQTSCYRLFVIFIIGDFSFTTNFIKYSKKFGFSIVFMNTYFKVYEVIGFRLEGNTILNSKQYEYDSLEIAKFIIFNKIFNQLKVLKSIRVKDEFVKTSIKNISTNFKKLNNALNIYEVMGIEGIIARTYFNTIFNEFNWNKREPQIKRDYLNSILDIGYTILFNYIDSILKIYGFDTYKGFLHRQFYMRKSLVCDIIEPFRVIIDLQIKKSINLKQFREKDFKVINKKYVLKWDENKKYVRIFSLAINEYREEIFLFIQSFYRNFMKNNEITKYRKFEI